jgi:hypothetical protein
LVEVVYDEERWSLLRELRAEALKMMKPLARRHIGAIAYGSIARGDVSEGSDIDIFMPSPPAPSILEALIEGAGYTIEVREIVQATPSYAAKGYIYIDEGRSYSFPLVEMRVVEREFYHFAGSITFDGLERGIRVPGVDKRLMLIEPTEFGHRETSIVGREGIVARLLGISVSTVLDRVRTLTRRKEIGRTGVYVKRMLSPEESFGEVLEGLLRSKPAMRRRLRELD